MPLSRMRLATGPWPTMAREARDTLFLLAVIGWIVLLQMPQLPPWTTAMALGVLLWRGALAWRQHALPRWPWRLGLALLALGLTWQSHRSILGPDAGVTLLAVLLALKTLELRAQRDAYVIFFLGFFALLSPLLHSQSLPMALGVLLAVWGLLAALILAHRPLGRPPLAQALRSAGTLIAAGAPLVALLFTLFPRLPPLWGIPSDSRLARSGLSGQMEVGDVARLALDDRVALRVAFPDGEPTPQERYFRGPVLRVFDGRRWRPVHGPDAAGELPAALLQAESARHLEPTGPPLRYRVTLEPTQRPWLLTLEATPAAPTVLAPSGGGTANGTPDGQWWLTRPITETLRYEGVAYPRHRKDPQLPRLALQIDRELPPGYNPRTLAWAQTLRRSLGEVPPRVLVQAVLEQLRTGGYRYTLEPGAYGRDSADEFWFDRRAGFCEHIASAFVVAMRALDIPARIVTGYQGGERNPVDGLWTIRHSDAHAWAEVWLDGEGWVRVDPTAAVAPDRTAVGQRLPAPAAGLITTAVARIDPTLLLRARALWDAANQRWNDWILDYGSPQQLQLLQALGWAASGWVDVARALATALGALAVLALLTLWWAQPRPGRWHRLLAGAARQWARAGITVAPPLTPARLAQAIEQHGAAALDAGARARWIDWLQALQAARYDPPVSTNEHPPPSAQRTLTQLTRWARQLPRPKAASPTRQPRRSGLVVLLAGLLACTCWAPTPTPAQTLRAGKPAPASTLPSYRDRADAMQLARAIDAAEGWDDAWAQRWIAAARPVAGLDALVLPPPPQAYKNWQAYRDRFVEPRRIAAGVRFWTQHAEALERAEQTYGVPAAVIVGIIGVETLYGQHTGRYRVLDVLATLALDFPPAHPRAQARQAFFRRELQAFLRLARQQGIAPDAWQGSYAGALGLPQFMPSSWLAYAVDFDGDGRIDLLRSAADAIGSVASFLHAHGWQRGLAPTFAVQPPPPGAALDTLLAPDIVPTFSVQQLQQYQATPEPQALAHPGPLALVRLDNGDPAAGGAPPSYVLGTGNFYALTRYNQSSYYAMAVLTLGEAVQRARDSASKMETR